jgi:16S rRNA (guanine527-N7)-methyltransferase
MTVLIDSEEQARAWMASMPDVSRGTLERLDHFAALLTEENAHQNLVAASTLGSAFWVRHIADSAQLLPLAEVKDGAHWVDLGSGPGLPGLVVAVLAPHLHMTLIESRRRRCDFLRGACATLACNNVTVVEARAERVEGRFDVISARAFAPLPELLSIARHLSHKDSVWLLPKGKNATAELSGLRRSTRAMFHVEHSVTSADARILVGKGVPPGE